MDPERADRTPVAAAAVSGPGRGAAASTGRERAQPRAGGAAEIGDITERKAAEEHLAQMEGTRRRAGEALRRSEERYRMILDGIEDYAIFMMDPAGQILSWHAGAERIKGYKADEIIGRNFACFFPREDVEQGRPQEVLRLTAAFGRHQEQGLRVRKDGSQFLASVTFTALRDPAGNLLGFSEFSHDLTERREAEARYRGLLEAAPDAMVVVNGAGEIVLLNVQAEKQFGYHRDELVGQKVTNIIPEGFAERLIADDLRSTEAALAQVIRTGIELVARRKDGSEFPIEMMLSPLASPDGILVTAAIRDISERKAAEIQLRQASEELAALNAELEDRVKARTAALEAANLELEAFSYSVSHDLRAPLRSIDGFSQILVREHAENLDTEARRLLDVVVRNVGQMGRLVDDLLAFSRVSRQELERQPVDMDRLARSVSDELRAAELERAIDVDIGPLGGTLGDSGLLRQVWVNLLGNAFKFTRPTDRPRIEIRCEQGAGECLYTVNDNGVGFDPTYGDNLFKPFQRLHPTAEFEGTGIGLAIVARIVQRHGGRVWAEGQPGAGATFGFSLPTSKEET